MSKFDSDYLDEASEAMNGHTDWAYWETLSKEEKRKYASGEGEATVVVFFKVGRFQDPAMRTKPTL